VVVDDLTKENYIKMREIAADDRVLLCWSAGGQLRFRRKSEPGVVVKVKSIYESTESIVG